jgi:peptidoglycan/xylan/chitin deacetylase (PgdA/CDA1 family)
MLSSVARLALDVALPGGDGARLSVLGYHRVLPQADPLLPTDPSVREFERTMRWVGDAFNVIPLSEAVAGLTAGKLPRRALAITFDDGYANNETLAAPVLERLGLHATFFIATGYLDGGRMFNDTVIEAVRGARDAQLDLEAIGLGCHRLGSDDDRRRAIDAILGAIKYLPTSRRVMLSESVAARAGVDPPSDLMMTSEQASRLARRGFALGAHTVTHPILAALDEDEAWQEIDEGRRQVQELAGAPIDVFAYPNGRPGRDYTAATVRLVRAAGFAGAVSSAPGAARPGSDPYQIPRFTPWDAGPLRFAARMWNNAVRVEPRLLPLA